MEIMNFVYISFLLNVFPAMEFMCVSCVLCIGIPMCGIGKCIYASRERLKKKLMNLPLISDLFTHISFTESREKKWRIGGADGFSLSFTFTIFVKI